MDMNIDRKRGPIRNVGGQDAGLMPCCCVPTPGLCRVRLLVETDLSHCSLFQDAHLSSKPLARVRHSSRPLQSLATPIDPHALSDVLETMHRAQRDDFACSLGVIRYAAGCCATRCARRKNDNACEEANRRARGDYRTSL